MYQFSDNTFRFECVSNIFYSGFFTLDKWTKAGVAQLAIYSNSKREFCGNAVANSRNVQNLLLSCWGKTWTRETAQPAPAVVAKHPKI